MARARPLLVGLMFASACGVHGPGGEDGEGGEGEVKSRGCKLVIAGVVHRSEADLRADLGGTLTRAQLAKVPALIEGIMRERCREDRWPGAYLLCLDRAPAGYQIKACDEKLPRELKVKLDKQLTAALGPLVEEARALRSDPDRREPAPRGGAGDGDGDGDGVR